MDNHPIPQDITGFQFKLIGQMTIKQFIYLAVGAGIAWFIFFVLPFPTIIGLPLAIISFVAGVAFAFLPIDGRPMDVMLGNFISAIFAPTRFIYRKEAAPPPDEMEQNQPLPSAPKQIIPPPAQQPQTNQVTSGVQNAPTSPVQNISPAQPYPKGGGILSMDFEDQQKKTSQSINFTPAQPSSLHPAASDTSFHKNQTDQEKLAKEEKKLEEKEDALKIQLSQIQNLQTAGQDAVGLSQNNVSPQDLKALLTQTIAQKQELEKQLLILSQKLSGQNTEKFAPSVAQPLKQTKNVKAVPRQLKKSAGLGNIPDAPNLITGIIKDPRGNPLPNILVEVKDTDDNPVRAFKTNALGQFRSATSLSNGVYQIIFEDPGEAHKFDTVEIEAKGDVIMPLEITSIDAREELRRELFN